MKKSFLTLTTCALLIGAALTSCNTPAQKVENAEKDVMKANTDLDQAREEYLIEMDAYRKATAERIALNNQSIRDFNARIDGEKKEAKADYRKKVADLEKKNSDMKKKMDNYKADGKDNWEKFKKEFGHDMDELGKAFKDLTVNNVK